MVDKPVIQYVVEEALASGISDILIITGRGKRAIEDHFGKSEFNHKYLDELDAMTDGVNLFYTRQREPRGLGDAVYHARSFASDDPFALLLGDTITIPACTTELIRKYNEYKTSIIAVEPVPAEKLSSYGIIRGKQIEADTHLIEDLVEKPAPEAAPSNLGILGRYILTPAIFDALEQTAPGKGNEIQLTDALRLIGEKKYAYVYAGRRYDIGNKLDWLKANIELSLSDGRFTNELGAFLRSLLREAL